MSSSLMIDTQLTALRDRRKSLETSSSVHANAVKEHRHKRSIELQKRLSDIVIDNENAKIRNIQLIDIISKLLKMIETLYDYDFTLFSMLISD